MRGQRVLVCENPNVLAAAADTLGAQCGPLVCTEGMPKTACHLLWGALTEAGVELSFHCDFDWGW